MVRNFPLPAEEALASYRPISAIRLGKLALNEPALMGDLKHLVDCLLPQSNRHPVGLGIIADDNPNRMRLESVSVRVAKSAEEKTIVEITESIQATEVLSADCSAPRTLERNGNNDRQPAV